MCISMCACVCRQRAVLRVINLNGEIKGLQTGSLIQLSISQLISTQERDERKAEMHGALRERW